MPTNLMVWGRQEHIADIENKNKKCLKHLNGLLVNDIFENAYMQFCHAFWKA